jgi:N-acetylneuraminate synthase
MVVHLGGMSLNPLPKTKNSIDKNSNHEKMINTAIHNFKKLDFCKSEIEIIPENLPPRPWYLGGQWFQYGFAPSNDMIKFCKETNTMMTFDVCHAFLQCKIDKIHLNDYTEKILDYISHVHISDAKGIDGEGIQINQGELDFKSLFNILNNIDFSWVTEVWSGHLNEGSETYKAMQILNKNFSNIL